MCRAEQRLRCNHANRFAFLRAFDSKHYLAGNGCKQSVILAHADIVTRVELSAALTNNDTTRVDQFSAVALYPQTF